MKEFVNKNNKKIKKQKIKLHKILPTIYKHKGTYKYSRYVSKWITPKQKQIKHKKQIQTKTEKQHFFNLSQNNTEKQQQPILFTKVSSPIFTLPQTLDIIMHKGKKIQYQGQNLFYKVPANQVLQSNGKFENFNISVPQMELKEQQYEIPSLVKSFSRKMHKVNLWLYSGQRYTNWHYDGHDNFLYVLKGHKKVLLSPPSQIKSKPLFSLFNNHSQEQKPTPAQKLSAIVKQGKCLFIPKGWWHKVYSYGNPNIAINFWFNSISLITSKLTTNKKNLILKSLLFEILENKCKKDTQNWQQMEQTSKQKLRKLKFFSLINDNDFYF